MPDLNLPEPGAGCAFCNREMVQDTVLYEGADFYIIADHAPIAAAHLLLIPRYHYPYLAALPAGLDAEYEALKEVLRGFVERNYGAVSYWENGGFGQSVPHAHLHAFSVPIDPAVYGGAGLGFSGIAGLRSVQQQTTGEYFMVEHAGQAHLLPPDWGLYMRVVDHARARSGGHFVRGRDERRTRGLPLVEALKQRWVEYEATIK